MPRKPKSERPSAEVLAPILAEILEQIVRDGPLTAKAIETVSRRFKKALIARSRGDVRAIADWQTRAALHGLRRHSHRTLRPQGVTVREMQAVLKEADAVEVSPDLTSAVTDGIVAEVTAWQAGRSRVCTRRSARSTSRGGIFRMTTRPRH